MNIGFMFWGFLIIYGIIMMFLSPKTTTVGGFFKGEDKEGKPASTFMLTASIFISWIFAKSVTNAANLGAKYGIVGGIAYATYWLCIPLAGFVIYRLRRKFGATGIVSFITNNYGKGAAIAFAAAILIRLFNEVWSNTSVVGGYYGKSTSKEFIFAALVFTIITLVYSMKGGLRSSIFTDAIQAIIFVFFVVWIIGLIIPKHSIGDFVYSGNWKLDAGVDMLLVSCLQIFSYPFHDPVLTDRGFISEEKTMLKAFVVSGVLGFIAILVFSFIGIHAKLVALPLSDNVPADLGRTMGVTAYLLMIMVMVSAAGSTLDSTFSSIAKLTAYDLPNMAGKNLGKKAITMGMIIMVVMAIIGNLPMIIGTNILKATTISGTMVIGLAPIFILHGIVKPTKLGFHLSFWCGIILGFALTLNIIPSIFAIGNGENAMLLGVNLYGLILCNIGYIIPGLLSKYKI
ncbi:sodium:solute symporter family transporter [Peptostreptococcus equinus]|uniref:Sodium:solute symporter n=1 Tax=Peptostreptococcus equinus TaxID=3003601 RepID=A0ABY7JR67_9FIRM|nr:sodium:solute symporter [Peptostreptococcus sp. CBA3647]WAW14538.1 sodium:solute symporter [Peptostreptococcus sp. CBA3647]